MTGVGYYTRYLIKLLPEVDRDATFVAWYLDFRALFQPRRRRLFGPAPNLLERWTPFPATWFERLSERYELPRLEWFTRFEVLFAPNFVPPPSSTTRLVLTVHDLAYRRFPDTAPLATRRWLKRLDRAIHRAAQVIVVSEATRRDLLDLYPVDPDRVTVIHHGVDRSVFRPPSAQQVDRVRRRYGIDGPYLLFLGGLEPRKNLPGLIRAFVAVPEDLRPLLVIAGSSVPWNPEGVNELRPVVEGLPEGIRRRLLFTGYVSDADKVALLGGARALVFPSLYEGFGMPVLEAMACGAPVLTSSTSSLPEVAGDAAVLVDPTDEAAIAEGMGRLLEDEGLRDRLREAGLERAAGFDWRDTARRTAMVLRVAAEG